MPGFLIDGVCYRSQLEAAQARASTESGRLESVADRTYVLLVTPDRKGSALKYTRVSLDNFNALEGARL